MFLMPGSRARSGILVPDIKLLNVLRANNSTSLADVTSLTKGFNYYEIVLTNVQPATNAVDLRLRVNSGGTVQTTSYVATVGYTAGSGFGNGTATTFIPLNGSGRVQNTGGVGVSGIVRLHGNPVTTTTIKHFEGSSAYNVGASSTDAAFFAGYWNSTAAIVGFEFSFSSGNITSGTIEVYARF